jgi:hypothetical protein
MKHATLSALAVISIGSTIPIDLSFAAPPNSEKNITRDTQGKCLAAKGIKLSSLNDVQSFTRKNKISTSNGAKIFEVFILERPCWEYIKHIGYGYLVTYSNISFDIAGSGSQTRIVTTSDHYLAKRRLTLSDDKCGISGAVKVSRGISDCSNIYADRKIFLALKWENGNSTVERINGDQAGTPSKGKQYILSSPTIKEINYLPSPDAASGTANAWIRGKDGYDYIAFFTVPG